MKIKKITYQDTHKQIEYIRNMFSSEEVVIPELSYFNKLLVNILTNYNDKNTPLEVFDALHVDRIYSALKNLQGSKNIKTYLQNLSKSTLNFHDTEQSHAKNILFELEVAGSLRKVFEDTYFNEPDIVVPFMDGNVGIACKKIVSIKNLQKQLSKGVKQIQTNGFEFGLVAINIDNLLPEEGILNVSSRDAALNTLHDINMKFINDNSRHFFKYIGDGRIMAILVVSSIIADIKNSEPRYLNVSQSTIWTLKGLEPKYKEKILKFKELALYN